MSCTGPCRRPWSGVAQVPMTPSLKAAFARRPTDRVAVTSFRQVKSHRSMGRRGSATTRHCRKTSTTPARTRLSRRPLPRFNRRSGVVLRECSMMSFTASRSWTRSRQRSASPFRSRRRPGQRPPIDGTGDHSHCDSLPGGRHRHRGGADAGDARVLSVHQHKQDATCRCSRKGCLARPTFAVSTVRTVEQRRDNASPASLTAGYRLMLRPGIGGDLVWWTPAGVAVSGLAGSMRRSGVASGRCDRVPSRGVGDHVRSPEAVGQVRGAAGKASSAVLSVSSATELAAM